MNDKEITVQELEERYKVFKVSRGKIGDREITIVDLKKAEGIYDYSVKITFNNNEDGSIIYEGDVGFFIFRGNICRPLTFFCGKEINPGYWKQKLECAERDFYCVEVDQDLAKKNIIDEIQKSYEEDQHLIESFDDDFIYPGQDNPEAWYDAIQKYSEDNDLEWDFETIGSIVESSIPDNYRYIYACRVLQWVSNKLKEDSQNGTN